MNGFLKVQWTFIDVGYMILHVRHSCIALKQNIVETTHTCVDVSYIHLKPIPKSHVILWGRYFLSQKAFYKYTCFWKIYLNLTKLFSASFGYIEARKSKRILEISLSPKLTIILFSQGSLWTIVPHKSFLGKSGNFYVKNFLSRIVY